VAQVWSTHLTLQAGGTSPARASLGPRTRRGQHDHEQIGEDLPAIVGTLRVGFPGSVYPDVRVRCDVWLPDSGTAIERIDVPLAGSFALPVNLFVYALTNPPDDVRVLVQANELIDANERFGLTQSEFVAAPAGPVPLEPWAEAVTLHDPAAVGEWLDSGGGSLGLFGGKDTVRPREAHSFNVTAADTVWTQHFST